MSSSSKRRATRAAPFWAVVAFAPFLLINFLQTLSVVIAPFSMRLFHRVNIRIAIVIWTWWSVILERIHGMRIVATGDALPAGESAVVFANHQSMADIVLLLCLARRTGRMGDMRWMVKGGMRFVPFLGWGMLSLDFLFLKRDWARDKAHIAAAFARFRGRADPVWLVLFPEGTRQTPAKLAVSRERAQRRGQPVTDRVMAPRTKGFVASVEGLRGKISAIYGITIIYPGGAASLYELFSGGVPEVRLRVKRHPLAAVPTDEKALSGWLQQEFLTMDEELRGGG